MMLLGLLGLASALDLGCNDNVVVYWGQNSYGGSHPTQKELWEKDLEFYCRQDDVDIIAISFLNVFNAGTGLLPEINFASHCETSFDSYPRLHSCPKIGQDIKFCQSQNKTILLSLGGAIANTNIPTTAAAQEFAATLWNMFMGGNHEYRPFGDAIVDGIDLDLEGGSQDNYDTFLGRLQEYYKTDDRKYLVTAAPQCEFPDRNLQRIMETAHVDAVFVQFYNNFCGVQNYNNPWAWNWPQWATWAATKSYNDKVRLFLGVPASRTAAGTGYVDLGKLKGIVNDLRNTYPVFGGMMLWDASQSENNLQNGNPFSRHTKHRLLAGGNCHSLPPPTYPTSTTSTTTTSISSTITTTYTSPPNPKPTNTCPVMGEPCSSGTACSGTNYAVCDHGQWLVYPCGEGTACTLDSNYNAYCDFPGTNPPPPCTNPHQLQLKSTYNTIFP
ncbi:Chitinase 2 [Entomophthora muscae]|uniref:Chitinase 2 n=1 Tax=Entomophthora muscae TaxID=34485 RepID=A0ACC2UE09_9FUNG|nr:Chitinase 2 [Entomophthora muscae]